MDATVGLFQTYNRWGQRKIRKCEDSQREKRFPVRVRRLESYNVLRACVAEISVAPILACRTRCGHTLVANTLIRRSMLGIVAGSTSRSPSERTPAKFWPLAPNSMSRASCTVAAIKSAFNELTRDTRQDVLYERLVPCWYASLVDALSWDSGGVEAGTNVQLLSAPA